jgi:hypothetical protein
MLEANRDGHEVLDFGHGRLGALVVLLGGHGNSNGNGQTQSQRVKQKIEKEDFLWALGSVWGVQTRAHSPTRRAPRNNIF